MASAIAQALNAPGVYNLAMFFKSGLGGWSERYPIGAAVTKNEPVTTLGVSIARMFTLCCMRAALLGRGDSIIWARVSITGKDKSSLPVLSDEIPALAVGTETAGANEVENSRNDALRFMLLDGVGHSSQRFFRGVRDGEVTANTWANVGTVMPLGTTDISALSGLTSGLPAFTTAAKSGASTTADAQYFFKNANAAGALTLSMAWTLWFKGLLTWTGYASRITRRGTAQVVGNYNLNPWAQDAAGAIFRSATTKKCGRVFGASRGAQVRKR